MKKSIVAIAVLAMRSAPAITLVQDGLPTATIVVRAEVLEAKPYQPARRGVDAKGGIKLAALDLQHYVEKISGATLPIVADSAAPSGALILVGASMLTESLAGVKIPSGCTSERKEEAYLIHCKDDTLLLAGNDDGPYMGTYYAVAEFLNRVGVRWIMPGECGEVIPQASTLTFADLHIEERPAFARRIWWCNQPPEMFVEASLWKLRNKMQVADVEIFSWPTDGSLSKFTPDLSLTNSRPELFARKLDGSLDTHLPNLTHPGAARIVADKIIAAIRDAEKEGERLEFLGLAPHDGMPMDHTPDTLAEWHQSFTDWVGRAGVPTERSISEEWFRFINRVAEHVVAEFPDFILNTNGYANRSLPPEGVALHPNLSVMLAQIWPDTLKPFYHPRSWHSQVIAEETRRWCELNPRVYLYNYNLTMLVTLLTPVPQVQKMAINYRYLKQWGLLGFANETRLPIMEEGIITRYMRAQLMWDPNLDLQATLDDYHEHWYGPAATPGAAFWKAIETCILDSPMLGHEDRILPFIYTPELLQTLEAHCVAAEALAVAEPYQTRVRIDRLTLDHLKAYMAVHAAEFDGRYADAAAQMRKMIEYRAQITAISPFLAMPPSKEGRAKYYGGDHYWGAIDRRDYYQDLADRMSGKTGDLIVMADRIARFALDEAAVGKALRWYEPGFDRRDWQDIDTTRPFYLQIPGTYTTNGVPYAGNMWYVFELDVPADAAGKSLQLYSPTVPGEAWTWINGQYCGHRKYLEAYIRPAPLDLDVTTLIKPGQRNTIAVWVNTGLNRTQAIEGFLGRLFLYAPKP
ncbi:MAG: DUF4838 domain-containing protein [Lentisphaerae bacterium]|nr:DUF4838 domain-containing protein [Lentisphaerota bacterium]